MGKKLVYEIFPRLKLGPSLKDDATTAAEAATADPFVFQKKSRAGGPQLTLVSVKNNPTLADDAGWQPVPPLTFAPTSCSLSLSAS